MVAELYGPEELHSKSLLRGKHAGERYEWQSEYKCSEGRSFWTPNAHITLHFEPDEGLVGRRSLRKQPVDVPE